jgi:hypothetical protein
MVANPPAYGRPYTDGSLSEFIPMAEAAMTAYVDVVGAETLSVVGRNVMAQILSDLLTLYACAADRTVRSLTADEIRGGIFVDGGRQVEFADGRAPITGLALTRGGLNSAIEGMKRRRTMMTLLVRRSELN